MENSLFLAVYLLTAFVLYFDQKSFLKNVERYMSGIVPMSPVQNTAMTFIISLFLPVLWVLSKADKMRRWLCGAKGNPDATPEEMEFYRDYYPEMVNELKRVSVELDRKGVVAFMLLVQLLFDAGFGSSRIDEVMQDTETLAVDDDNRHVFYPTYEAQRVPFALEIKRIKKDVFKLTFFTQEELTVAINRQIEMFCR